MTVELRPAAVSDAPAMAEVFVAAWRHGYVGVVPDPVLAALDRSETSDWLGALLSEGGGLATTVAVDGPDVVGFTRYGADPERPEPDAGYLAALYVHPDTSGRGVGRRLLDHVLAELHRHGRDDVTLWVFAANDRARRLYRAAGFTADGAETVDERWQAPQVRYRRRSGVETAHQVGDDLPVDGRLDVRSPTEVRNPRTTEIDLLPTVALLELINDEDRTVPDAVRRAIPEMARLVDLAVDALAHGGRIHYFGAGSSGRLGLLDAAELPPTFGVDDVVLAHLAGGDGAMRRAVEGAEDGIEHGARDAAEVTAADVVIGLAASGYTRYVRGALRQARTVGAVTALVTSNPEAPVGELADVKILVDTGPEVLTGSTRLKSATAQKLVLNAFSTAVMVRSGRTWSNLMVGVMPTNAKLRGRVVRMLAMATGASDGACRAALDEAGGDPPAALVVLCAGVPADTAHKALADADGSLQAALRQLGAPDRPTT